MKKFMPLLIFAAVLAVFAVAVLRPKSVVNRPPLKPFRPDAKNPLSLLPNMAFQLEGKQVKLFEGRTEKDGSAIGPQWRIGLTTYQAAGDLNGDGTGDAACVIVKAGGKAGSYYYLVAALALPWRDHALNPPGYGQQAGSDARATNTLHLGDRIELRKISIESGIIEVDVVRHDPGSPETERPTVFLSRRFTVVNGVLIERN